MTVDLAALEDPTLAGYVQSIPLNVDPFPYADLQAQGRYPIQSSPDTIPQMLAYLAGVDAENGQGGRVGYIDTSHRLLVHDPNPAGGGGPTKAAVDNYFFIGPDVVAGSHADTSVDNSVITIYSASLVAYFDAGQVPTNGYLEAYLRGWGPLNQDYGLGVVALSSSGDCGTSAMVWPNGMDVTNAGIVGAGLIRFEFVSNVPAVTAVLRVNTSSV